MRLLVSLVVGAKILKLNKQLDCNFIKSGKKKVDILVEFEDQDHKLKFSKVKVFRRQN